MGARGILATALSLLIAVAATTCTGRGSTEREIPSAEAQVVLFFGDSITRGQGVAEGRAFPALLQSRMKAEGLDYRCVNAGISGDTTSGALARIERYLDEPLAVVVVALGTNDVFRSVNRLRSRANLVRIVRAFEDTGARVILAGMKLPHFHPAYGLSMDRMYRSVAAETDAELLPDLLAGVAGVAERNLADGIHPNTSGHLVIAGNLWPLLRPLL